MYYYQGQVVLSATVPGVPYPRYKVKKKKLKVPMYPGTGIYPGYGMTYYDIIVCICICIARVDQERSIITFGTN